MSTQEPVIIYRYDTSPFSHKIDNVLSLKKINYSKVDVSPTLPRPEITDYLGISYRRIPILAIGNDIYCDTSLIISALERRFPAEKGFETVFPLPKNGGSPDTGLIRAFSKFYADDSLFPLAADLLPWARFPKAFIDDRSKLRGSAINTNAIAENVPNTQSLISSHVLLVEEQLKDSREWLFNTVRPSIADISVHFVFAWARSFKGSNTIFDAKKFPFTIQWLDRMTALINKERQAQAVATKLSGEDAAVKITSYAHEPYNVVGFDVGDASLLRFAIGDVVQVAPVDTGRSYPTTGKLVALSQEEITLEVQGSKGLVRCHFPRLSFFIRPAPLTKL
ncbi:hypothetical protein CPB84DRAFT_1840648 [Gymnopilus junonius]|uniref:GST N-terminal domain-containing protein n=1 Tax=Gymnopilus junonius TaxID=109634 RepID=A0A9P5TVN7_GYMJU|nr:hypothetical protein CPB84DRAFT_1840648 [Gymnopilus junonius]